eukprot:14581765-Heterocapsa_arctica.AAC.1
MRTSTEAVDSYQYDVGACKAPSIVQSWSSTWSLIRSHCDKIELIHTSILDRSWSNDHGEDRDAEYRKRPRGKLT